PEDIAGDYANFANISFSRYEFTLTFARIEHEIEEGDVPGAVVARVYASPRFMEELSAALQDSWSKWQTTKGIRNLAEAPPHDLAVRGTIDLSEFSGDAGTAARWTRDVLTTESLAFLSSLEPYGTRAGVALFHGSARDPVWEYVLSDTVALATLELTEAPVVL